MLVFRKNLSACKIYVPKQTLFQGLLCEYCSKFNKDDDVFDRVKFNKKIAN